ncbi:MAG TPA: hypothetical protein DHV35_07600, partial [Halieaceae bacterium]|nr:hypothetical protein [Halieaceae bacterium]
VTFGFLSCYVKSDAMKLLRATDGSLAYYCRVKGAHNIIAVLTLNMMSRLVLMRSLLRLLHQRRCIT